MYNILITAKQGKILVGGVKQVTSEQSTLLDAVAYVAGVVSGQEDRIDIVTIQSNN